MVDTRPTIIPVERNVLSVKDLRREPHHCAEPLNGLEPFVAFRLPHYAYQEVHKILGSEPSLRLLASTETSRGGNGRSIFHEAGVYVRPRTKGTDAEVWITSNILPEGEDGVKIDICKLSLGQAGYGGDGLRRSSNDPSVFVAPGVEYHPIKDTGVVMGNGGTGYGDEILFCTQGQDLKFPPGEAKDAFIPSSLMLVNPRRPHDRARQILNNFHGRVFNSLNDVAVHHSSGYIFFTDPDYGREQGFKQAPQLPNAIWRFHPRIGSLQMVADGLQKPNGITFSPDQKVCYVTDTDFIHGDGGKDGRRAGTIYAYDVVTFPPRGAPALHNKRVFAFVDCGAPDGIKCDTDGNVYTGCFDGVHIFAPSGDLLAKIVLPPDSQGQQRGCANLVFGAPGRLIILAETTVWEARIGAVGDPKKDVQ